MNHIDAIVNSDESFYILNGNMEETEKFLYSLFEKIFNSSNNKTIKNWLKNEQYPNIKILGKENKIKLEDIRNINFDFKNVFSNQKIIFVLYNENNLTTRCQNALLKILEDIPKDCVFFIANINCNSLIPTIQSRGKVINLFSEISYTDNEFLHFLELYTNYDKNEIDKLNKIEKFFDEIKEDIETIKDNNSLINKMKILNKYKNKEYKDKLFLLFSIYAYYFKSNEYLKNILLNENYNLNFSITLDNLIINYL